MSTISFDLELFQTLNQEYASKRVQRNPRQFDARSRELEATKRSHRLERAVGGIREKRVLEVGCGRADVARVLAVGYGCEAVGIDLDPIVGSKSESDRLSVEVGDIADPDLDLGTFDVIYSFSVWEHLVHPYAALANSYRLLRPGGKVFLQAQLYRGPMASHRYREVFFPWPHLLFTAEVFEAFYVASGRQPRRPAWLNKLTYQQYRDYFGRAGFDVQSCRATGPPIFDEGFYQRFHSALSAYPRWDLGHDAIIAVLQRPATNDSLDQVTNTSSEQAAIIDQLQTQIRKLKSRRSLRTADYIGRRVRRMSAWLKLR